ncbi:MAG TPA: hypothetical protein VM491_18750, partial [Burkholderiaceae bacterium]|nr:hypothetical protein [Burkholderiaceae bacterium]
AAAVEAAHRAILDGIAAEPQTRAGMGATIVIAACDATHVGWAHCGDSRLYRFVGGTLHGFTRDHSVAAMIEPPRRDERPNAARNQLLRVLGVSDDPIEFDVHPPVALEPNERWLLCTDGWWELVLETEMEQDLAASSSPAEWLQRMEQRIERRLDADSDNYTAIAVWSD